MKTKNEVLADPYVRALIKDFDVTVERAGEIYGEAPGKLEAIADPYVRALMRDQVVTLDQVGALYNENPEKLTELASVAVRTLPQAQFQESLQEALLPIVRKNLLALESAKLPPKEGKRKPPTGKTGTFSIARLAGDMLVKGNFQE
jgi:hypothetical protein